MSFVRCARGGVFASLNDGLDIRMHEILETILPTSTGQMQPHTPVAVTLSKLVGKILFLVGD